jgi:hypothetical protein
MYSTCSACGLEFAVRIPTPKTVAKVGGSAHTEECGIKVRHASVAEAFARCLVLDDIPHRYRDTMQFYLCRWCHKVHMGHGGKGKKNVVVAYSHAEARLLYEEAIQKGELVGFSEIIRK